MLNRRFSWLAWTALALWLPAAAGAFSFGTFSSGDTIASIQLSSGQLTDFVDVDTGADPNDPADDTLVFQAAVSTITMDSGTIYNIPLGDVLVQSTVMLVSGSELFFSTVAGADWVNGIVADISIVDIADSGNVLLAADYDGAVTLQITQFSQFVPITGSLSGDFIRQTGSGDADFEAAFGSGGNFFATLAGWDQGGTAPSSLCDLTNGFFFSGNCLGPTDFADFTAQPTTTIVPVPEPGLTSLLLAGALSYCWRRRSRLS